MQKITANLMVADMGASLAFYCEVLGFSLSMGVSPDREILTDGRPRADLVFALIVKDAAELMLQRRDSMTADVPAFPADAVPGGTFTLYIRGEDADALAARLPAGVEVIKGPETSWYGMREIFIRDPDGYVLALGAPDGPSPA
ncbi:MAG: VOC family protein [Alphaproteobacteria bacterium]|nr:VOC family protein [Alphaproteobacteria bacterium]